MDSDTIEKITNELLLLKQTKTKEEIDSMEQFLEIRTKQKMLYETILSNDFNKEIFKEMMKMKRRLEAGEDQYSVDVRFGKFMAEKYIDPVVKKS